MRWMAWMMLVALCAACGDDDSTTDDVSDAAVVDMNEGSPDLSSDMARPDAFVPRCTTGCGLVEVAAGADYSCARRENGQVLCWGGNLFGQLGDGSSRHGMTCGMTGVEAKDCSRDPVDVEGVTAETIDANGLGTCALGADDQLMCWGLTDAIPEGSDSRRRVFTPEARAGFDLVSHFDKGAIATCAVKTDGTLICAGQNDSGQIGVGDFDPHTVAVEVELAGVVELELGGEFSCARTASEVYCWGENTSKQLGDDSSHSTCGVAPVTYDCSGVPVAAAIDGSMVAELALGASHACARMTDDTVSCWGFNGAGQVGQAAGTDVGVPATVDGLTGVTHIAAGRDTTCAIVTGGDVKCWGANSEGQLGDGVEVGEHDTCANVRGETIDCSSTPVDVALGEPAVDIAVGSQHTCAAGESGAVYCWGWNDQRQLGPMGAADRSRSTTPIEVTGF